MSIPSSEKLYRCPGNGNVYDPGPGVLYKISKNEIVLLNLKLYQDAVAALNEWWEKTKAADWATLRDIKETFNSVDYVGNDRYVFNIKGNKYRLVGWIR